MAKKIKCKQCAAEFMPTMDKPACPGCGATPAASDTMAASALAALPEVGSEAALPADIQVFPPGNGVRFTLQDYPGEEFEVDIDASTAERLDADLQNLLARAAANQGSEPFADKNHEDAERTFVPLRYFWGGDDKIKGGVRLGTGWVPFGAQLVRAKAFKYFSQNFLFSKAGRKVLGLINENVELIPVKFLANVVHAGAIRAKGSVLAVTEEEALKLIEGKHVEEHFREPQQQMQQQPPPPK